MLRSAGTLDPHVEEPSRCLIGPQSPTTASESKRLARAALIRHHLQVDPQYPIGKFHADADVTAAKRQANINHIAALPEAARRAIRQLPAGALDRPYREGGWTARQVVHHLADSHLNAYMRMRLALTEDNPIIRPYQEARWAELHDARSEDPELSLTLLTALHARWVSLLTALRPEEFGREAQHPVWGRVDLDWFVQIYSWHGRHHTEHIKLVR